MLSGLRHREVVFHTEEDRVHMHDFLHQVYLEVGVLSSGDCDGAVVSVTVHAAVLVAHRFEFLPAGIPVDALSVLVRLAGGADPFFIEADSRPRIRHYTSFAVLHGFFLSPG